MVFKKENKKERLKAEIRSAFEEETEDFFTFMMLEKAGVEIERLTEFQLPDNEKEQIRYQLEYLADVETDSIIQSRKKEIAEAVIERLKK